MVALSRRLAVGRPLAQGAPRAPSSVPVAQGGEHAAVALREHGAQLRHARVFDWFLRQRFARWFPHVQIVRIKG